MGLCLVQLVLLLYDFEKKATGFPMALYVII